MTGQAASRDKLVSDPRSGVRDGAARRRGPVPPAPARSADGATVKDSPPVRRTGGRTQQAPAMPPAGDVVPDEATTPVPAAIPRSGGRTQQGARVRARKGGRSQQGTQGGQDVRPGTPPKALPADNDQDDDGGRLNTATAEGSGAFLALFLYPLIFNLLRGGKAGAIGWLKAKFINAPMAANSVSAQPARGSGGGGLPGAGSGAGGASGGKR